MSKGMWEKVLVSIIAGLALLAIGWTSSVSSAVAVAETNISTAKEDRGRLEKRLDSMDEKLDKILERLPKHE